MLKDLAKSTRRRRRNELAESGGENEVEVAELQRSREGQRRKIFGGMERKESEAASWRVSS